MDSAESHEPLPAFGEGAEAKSGGQIEEIPLDAISLNPYQPRRTFAPQELAELAESIRSYGILQPVVVRPRGQQYELVVGERRWRASRLAGLTHIPAVIREVSEKQMALIALVENLQREDLNSLEEAAAYEQAITEFRLTQEELAREVGKSQSTIANKLRLLRLPAEVQESISREIISERHARALLRIPYADEQLKLLAQIISTGLTVRETEGLVEQRLNKLARPGEPVGPASGGQKVIRVFKDLRIFLNGLRQTVNAMQKAGIRARMSQEDRGEHIEVTIRISKAPVQR